LKLKRYQIEILVFILVLHLVTSGIEKQNSLQSRIQEHPFGVTEEGLKYVELIFTLGNFGLRISPNNELIEKQMWSFIRPPDKISVDESQQIVYTLWKQAEKQK